MPASVVDSVFTQVFSQVSPSATDTHHHAFSILANSPDKEFGGRRLSAAVKMVQLD
jgi:hypothetical protein